MLTLYTDRKDIDSSLTVVNDMEVAFIRLRGKLTGTDAERRILQNIEQGTWMDREMFLDRFGVQVYVRNMSTGCKAALCVENGCNQEVYNLIECGDNTISEIVNYCKNGNVLIDKNARSDLTYGFEDCGVEEVKIRVGNYVFHTIERLNYFLEWELGTGEADMEIEGVSLYS